MRGRRRLLLLVGPLLLTGCAGPAKAPAEDANNAGPSWIIVSQGKATQPPKPPAGAKPSPLASGFLPLKPPGTAAPESGLGCVDKGRRRNQIQGLTVVPGPGTATVRWSDIGGSDIVAYRLTATSQDLKVGRQRDIGFQTIPRGKPCGEMTATIRGLDRATVYTVSLEAVVTSKNSVANRSSTIARSLVVYIS